VTKITPIRIGLLTNNADVVGNLQSVYGKPSSQLVISLIRIVDINNSNY